MTTRRKFFLFLVASAGTSTAICANAQNRAQNLLDPKSLEALSLGYVPDSKKADKLKYAYHSNVHRCNNCQLFVGSTTDVMAPCAIFSGQSVAGRGWCSAHARKSG